MNKLPWKRFFVFVTIGGLGFVVEAVIILLLTSKFDFATTVSRFFSFPCAVLVTWWFNRQWNFRSQEGVMQEVGRYFASQGLGALTNLAAFAGCLYVFPSLSAWPILVLGFGAIAGLIVNFTLSNRYVFTSKREADGH